MGAIVGGKPVWFGCDVGKMRNNDLGIWDARLYDLESVYDVSFSLDKAERLALHDTLMTHAMLFTGVDVVDGSPRKWRVENSWGDEKADKGFWTMNDNWFSTSMCSRSPHAVTSCRRSCWSLWRPSPSCCPLGTRWARWPADQPPRTPSHLWRSCRAIARSNWAATSGRRHIHGCRSLWSSPIIQESLIAVAVSWFFQPSAEVRPSSVRRRAAGSPGSASRATPRRRSPALEPKASFLKLSASATRWWLVTA